MTIPSLGIDIAKVQFNVCLIKGVASSSIKSSPTPPPASSCYRKSRLDCSTRSLGIGETTAAALLAEVPDFKQYRSARQQVAAFAGLVTRERQSGLSVRGRVRLLKTGISRLRKALYFPAITALRCSPLFQQCAEGLRQRCKSKLAVIGAAMRKLIHLAYGVLKSGKPFDPEWMPKAKTLDREHSISPAPIFRIDERVRVGRRVHAVVRFPPIAGLAQHQTLQHI